MKVYREVVIDIKTGRIVKEDSYEYNGPIAKCGGGSSGGTVDYADWIKVLWQEVAYQQGTPNINVGASLIEVLNSMMGLYGNPYYDPSTGTEQAYDPSLRVLGMDSKVSDYISRITSDATFETTKFGSLISKAITEAANAYPNNIDLASSIALAISSAMQEATDLVADVNIDNMVTEYENESKPQHLRNVSRFAAGMADINAVQSSAFVIGMALMENQFSKEVSRFRAQIKAELFSKTVMKAADATASAYINRYATRDGFIAQAVNMMHAIFAMYLNAHDEAMKVGVETERMSLVAEKEQKDRQLEIDVAFARWDADTLQFAGNFIAALSGGVMAPIGQKPSTAQSALGGALSGAAAGAATGNPILAGVGAVLGGIGGALSS